MTGLSEKEENPGSVSIDVCNERHAALTKEIGNARKDLHRIKDALIGKDLKSGLVKDVADVKNNVKNLEDAIGESKKTKWSTRDKAYIVIGILSAIIPAVASIYISLTA